MISKQLLRRYWNRSRQSKQRADLLKRLHVGEQLEVRSAPGSMIVDVLALGGHAAAIAQLAMQSAQEPQQFAAGGEQVFPDGVVRTARPEGRGHSAEQRESVADGSRVDQPSRPTESEHPATPVRRHGTDTSATKANTQQNRRFDHTAADALFSSILVGTGLDDGLDASGNESHRPSVDGDSGAHRTSSSSSAGTSGGQLPDLPEGSAIASGNAARDTSSSSLFSRSGNSDIDIPITRGVSPVNTVEVGPSTSTPPSSIDSIPPTASSTVPAVASDDVVSTPAQASPVLAGTRPRQTLDLGFTNGLTGWNIHEIGGSPEGKGTVTAGSAILREGDSFLVTLDQDLVIPQAPINLSFTYEAAYDTSDPDSINDAFEAVLTTAAGSPLVYSFAPDRDAYFNLTEQMSSALGTGTTEETVTEGKRVSTDISQIAPGTEATLLFRLVNNDSDVETTIHILSVQLTSGDDALPVVTVGLTNDTAPDGPGGEPYRTDLLTNDPRIGGTATDDHAVALLEVQIDDGPFADITAAMVNGQYSFDPGTLLPGTHRLTVRATDSFPQTAESTIEFVVNAPPIADAGGNRTASEGDTVAFDGWGSYDTEDALYRFVWEFHDGSSVDNASSSFTYLQDGTFPVSLTVTDTAGSTSQDTVAVTVLNLPAAIDPPPDQQSSEGQAITFTTSFADPGILDTHTATVEWGDGTLPEPAQIVEQDGVGSVSGTHQYKDDGRYTVTIRVTDSDGAESGTQFEVQVANLAPTVVTATDLTGDEGQLVDFVATFTDAGILDMHTAVVSWSDGTQTAGAVAETNGSGTVTATHIFADNGVYPIRVDVTDNAGDTGSREATATIANVAPVVVATENQTFAEGQSFGLHVATFSDPGFTLPAAGNSETFSASISWGDSTPTEVGTIALVMGSPGIVTTGVVSGTHTYANDGQYTVDVTVADDDGGIGTSSFVVTVGNLAPTVVTATDLTGDEGQLLDFVATFTDAGVLDTHSATMSWSDGTQSVGNVVEANGSGTVTASHIFADNGVYPIRVDVTDNAGDIGSRAVSASIANVAPAIVAAGNQEFAEGQSFDLSVATFSDPGFTHSAAGTNESFAANIDWGDGTPD